MPDSENPSSAPWGARSCGSYAIANGFIAIFGPRPNFIFNTVRAESAWLEWIAGGRHRGLARFRISKNGMIDELPIAAGVPEKKRKCWTSSRQFAGRV